MSDDRDQFPVSTVDITAANQFFTQRLQDEGTWLDLMRTNVGAFIRRIFSGSVVSLQYNIIVAARNAFYKTATRPSSIYALARSQGIFIERVTSSAITCTLTNTGTATVFVVPYSLHLISGAKFYNSAQYYVSPGSTVTVELTQGEVRTKTFDLDTISDLTGYEFLLGEDGFTVTDDLYVITKNKSTGATVQWTATQSGFFELTEDDACFFHGTTGTGDCSLTFGDGTYGKALTKNSNMTVRYVYSGGDKYNDILPGVRVEYSSTLYGQTIETSEGGAGYKDSSYYKTYAPYMFRARKKYISQSEIKALISTYLGVADCAVLGQRDIAPDDKTWMNTIRICILPTNADTWGGTNPNPKSATWQNFVDYISPMLLDPLEIQTWNPTKVYTKVTVTIAIFESYMTQEATIVAQAQENILALFKKRAGILQRRLTQSDIEKACTIDGVDWIEVTYPEEKAIILDDPTSYIVLSETPTIIPTISSRTA